MQFIDVLVYFSLLVSITIAPGPLMAILVARTLSRDMKGAVAFGVGIAIGDVAIIALVCAGLGVWLQATPEIFDTAKLIAVIYLLWIAINIWKGSVNNNQKVNNKGGTIAATFAGVLTCVVSPQTLLLYLMILPKLIDVTSITVSVFSALALITFSGLAFTFVIVIILADRFRSLLESPSRTRNLNRVLAVLIGLSGIWMVTA